MHIFSINFLSFTAQIYNAWLLHMQAKNDFWHLGDMAPLPSSLNAPMSRRTK